MKRRTVRATWLVWVGAGIVSAFIVAIPYGVGTFSRWVYTTFLVGAVYLFGYERDRFDPTKLEDEDDD